VAKRAVVQCPAGLQADEGGRGFCLYQGSYVWNPGRHEFYTSAGNVLAAEHTAMHEGTHWAGDFTYIRTGSGWLYHAVVIDLYSRRVVGWSFGCRRNSELTNSTLRMALLRERPRSDCVLHSDQDIEYAAH
jgi:transposase InsO family protein